MAGIQQFGTARIAIGNELFNCSVTSELCANDHVLRLIVKSKDQRHAPIGISGRNGMGMDFPILATVEIVVNSLLVANSLAWNCSGATRQQNCVNLYMPAAAMTTHQMHAPPTAAARQKTSDNDNGIMGHRAEKRSDPLDIHGKKKQHAMASSVLNDPCVIGSENSNRRSDWTSYEDNILLTAMRAERQPYNNWSNLKTQLPGRRGKQIRDRWVNVLNPNLNHAPFTRQDDLLLWGCVNSLGRRWVQISVECFQSTRSENQVKNRWYSREFKDVVSEEFGPSAYEVADNKVKTMAGQGKNIVVKEVTDKEFESHASQDANKNDNKKTRRKKKKVDTTVAVDEFGSGINTDAIGEDGAETRKRKRAVDEGDALSSSLVSPHNDSDNDNDTTVDIRPSANPRRVKQDPPAKEEREFRPSKHPTAVRQDPPGDDDADKC